MSERWIKVSEKILDQIKRLEEANERDRLELLRSLRFMLSSLQRSLLGWMQWVIRTTPFFADYFGLSHDLRAMKRQIKSIFKQGKSNV